MDFLTLKNGPTLPWPVLHLAIDLELRGIKFSRQMPKEPSEQPRLIVTSVDGKPQLSDQESDQIRASKLHLLALVEYCEQAH